MRYRGLVVVGLLGLMAGCQTYADRRPPLDQLDSRDKGLQSKDLLNVTDQMTADLLSLPALNQSSRQWTIVTTNMENETTKARNYDIFIDRLKTNLSQKSDGRITLIENRSKFNQLRSQELDTPSSGFGQGDGTTPSNRLQPDLALYGRVQDMPNRGTDTFRFEFTLTNLKTGVQVWSRDYLVKVGR